MFFNWDSLLFLKKIRSKVQVLRGDIIIISFCHSEGNFGAVAKRMTVTDLMVFHRSYQTAY